MRRWMNAWKTENGFTLLELIVIVIILSVLAGIALVIMSASGDAAKDAIVKADLRMLAAAVKVYKAKEGDFPESLDALLVEGPKGYKPLLDELPMDPYAEITEDDPSIYYNYNKTSTEVRISSDKNGAEFIRIIKK